MTVSHDVANEQIILGSALASKVAFNEITSQVDAEHFLIENHKAIMYGLSQCLENNLEADLDTISGFAKASKYQTSGEVYSYLVKVKNAYDHNKNLAFHIEKLKADWIKNKVSVDFIPDILGRASRPNTDIGDLLSAFDNAIGELYNLSSSGVSGFVDMGGLSAEYAEEIEKRRNSRILGAGYEAIDKHLGEGFVPKNISVIGAFSGIGKSTLIANMMRRQARLGMKVGLYSLEMKRLSILDLFNSMESGIPLKKLTRPPLDLTEDQIEQVLALTKSRIGSNIYINDRAALNMAQLVSEIRRFKQMGTPLDVVYIDLFGKVEEVDTGENTAQLVQRELKRLRQVARQLDVHFCLAAQLNRESQKKVGGVVVRPEIRHIKNSNAYQEEADLVFLLHRTKHYDQELTDDIMEVEIAKQRMGECGRRAFLEYDGEFASIRPTELVPEDLRDD